MNQDTAFIYKYSAKTNMEIQEIRKKYLPREESKLEELRRLDRTVQNAGMIESLCTGIGAALAFGLGLCLTMQVLGKGFFLAVLGVLFGIIGMMGMLAAYPVYRKMFKKTKEKHTARILELTEALMREKIG